MTDVPRHQHRISGAGILLVPDEWCEPDSKAILDMGEDDLTNALIEAMSLPIDPDYKPTPYLCDFQRDTLRAEPETTD